MGQLDLSARVLVAKVLAAVVVDRLDDLADRDVLGACPSLVDQTEARGANLANSALHLQRRVAGR